MHAKFPADDAAAEASNLDWQALRRASDFAALGEGGLLADRFVIRLDGVILTCGRARDGAAEWLRAIADRYVLVSSNSRDTARTMAAKLRRIGLDVPEQRIVLAGEEALRFAAAQYPGARCKVLASRVLAHAARSHGLELVQDNAEVILLGRDSAWTYRDLVLVVQEMARGARLIASNDDLTRIGHSGRAVPDTGAILASIVAAADEPSDILRFSRAATLRVAQERLGAALTQAVSEALLITSQAADLDAVSAVAGLRCLHFDPDAAERPRAEVASPSYRVAAARGDAVPAGPAPL